MPELLTTISSRPSVARCALYQRFDLSVHGDIGREDQRATSLSFDGRRGVLEVFLGAGGHRHVCPRLREREGDGASETSAGPRDDGHASVEPKCLGKQAHR